MTDDEAATVEQIAIEHFRGHNQPRRHIPRIWWDGHGWNMSVRDPHNEHHTCCADTWPEIQEIGKVWYGINKARGLVPAKHGLAA